MRSRSTCTTRRCYILPLVERVMTVPQWEALGERGRAGIPKDRQLVFLGIHVRGQRPRAQSRVPGASCRWRRGSPGNCWAAGRSPRSTGGSTAPIRSEPDADAIAVRHEVSPPGCILSCHPLAGTRAPRAVLPWGEGIDRASWPALVKGLVCHVRLSPCVVPGSIPGPGRRPAAAAPLALRVSGGSRRRPDSCPAAGASRDRQRRNVRGIVDSGRRPGRERSGRQVPGRPAAAGEPGGLLRQRQLHQGR